MKHMDQGTVSSLFAYLALGTWKTIAPSGWFELVSFVIYFAVHVIVASYSVQVFIFAGYKEEDRFIRADDGLGRRVTNRVSHVVLTLHSFISQSCGAQASCSTREFVQVRDCLPFAALMHLSCRCFI